MATPRRPSSWEIVTAYLREAYEERARGEAFASGIMVEQRLGLSQLEGMDFMRELEDAGLIKMAEAENAVAYYRLGPRGFAFMEQLPSLEALVRRWEATIAASLARPKKSERRGFVSERNLERSCFRRARTTRSTTLRRSGSSFRYSSHGC